MEELSIGRMAQLNCVSEKTLRYYQEKGLLEPKRVNPETGRRYYSYDQCSTIDMIQQLQSLGFTLDEIKKLVDSNSIDEFENALKSKQCQIKAKLDDLMVASENARNLVFTYQTLRCRPLCDQIILERIGERMVLPFDILNPNCLSVTDDGRGFIKEWEINLRLTKRYMLDAGLPLALFRRVGCQIDRNDLATGTFRLKSSLIFVEESAYPLFGVERRKSLQTLPEGMFLTMYKDHYTEEDGGSSEYRGLNEILCFARDHGFALAGDYYGEVVADTPAFLYEGREMLYKLQVPVVPA